jgi:hypothetical protein
MWILPSVKSRMRGSESNRAQAGARRNRSASLAMSWPSWSRTM